MSIISTSANEQKNLLSFPADEWCSASIIAVSVAFVPANPMFKDSKDGQQYRFLFAGYVPDENGAPTVVRKWSRWFNTSNNEKSAVMKFFGIGTKNDIPDLAKFVLDTDRLLNTPLKIQLTEKVSGDKTFMEIAKAKGSMDKDSLGITYTLIDPNDPSIVHKPTKLIKHFGKFVDHLKFACRTDEGIKEFNTEDMDEPKPMA